MIPKRPQATVKLLAAPACQRAHDSDLSPAPRCTSDLDARSGATYTEGLKLGLCSVVCSGASKLSNRPAVAGASDPSFDSLFFTRDLPLPQAQSIS